MQIRNCNSFVKITYSLREAKQESPFPDPCVNRNKPIRIPHSSDSVYTIQIYSMMLATIVPERRRERDRQSQCERKTVVKRQRYASHLNLNRHRSISLPRDSIFFVADKSICIFILDPSPVCQAYQSAPNLSVFGCTCESFIILYVFL